MQVRGMRASATYQAEPDIAAWMDTCALNPAQVLPEQRDDPALLAARQRMVHVSEAGMARLTELAELHAAE
jgi:ribulose kinase